MWFFGSLRFVRQKPWSVVFIQKPEVSVVSVCMVCHDRFAFQVAMGSIDLSECINEDFKPLRRDLCARMNSFALVISQPHLPHHRDGLTMFCRGDKTFVRWLYRWHFSASRVTDQFLYNYYVEKIRCRNCDHSFFSTPIKKYSINTVIIMTEYLVGIFPRTVYY